MKTRFTLIILLISIFSFSSMAINCKEKLKVIIFLSEECPISQYYTSEINRINSLYSDNIELTVLFPMKSSSEEKIEKFVRTYKVNFRTKLDTSQLIAKQFKATTTPEAILLADGKIIYQGCIDDKFAALGVRRKKAKNHYLIDAINQSLQNKEIKNPTTKTIGCSITYF